MFRGIRMGRKVLGLELSEQSVKIAIVNNGANPELLHCSEVTFAAYFGCSEATFEGEEALFAAAVDILKDMKAERKRLFHGLHAVSLCLDLSHTIVRPLKLPALDERELDAAVEFELSKSFPGIGKTHNISFKEYSRDEQEVSGLVSFAPRTMLDTYHKFLKQLGYKTAYIDVASNTQAKAFLRFAQKEDDAITLLCDIGRQNTLFTILRGSQVLHSRQINQGVPVLYELPSAPDFSDLELSEPMLLALRQSCSEIVGQLQQTIEFFNYNQDAQQAISQIKLLGDPSLFPKLLEYFSARLSIPVSLIAPQEPVNTEPTSFLRMFSAIGAAIRED